jgi:hypothetical protein
MPKEKLVFSVLEPAACVVAGDTGAWTGDAGADTLAGEVGVEARAALRTGDTGAGTTAGLACSCSCSSSSCTSASASPV